MALVDSNPSWLNQEESDRLEYKSADALKHRESIVRAVVALLNHRGGHVVVGVDDKGKPEGIPGLERERDRLQTMLVDAIEPRPPVERIVVRCTPIQGAQVLEIEVDVSKSATKPVYAERRQGLYGFWMRSGSTTRALTLREVAERAPQKQDAALPKRWDEPLNKNAQQERDIVLVLQAEFRQQDWNREALKRVLATERRAEVNRRPMGWTIVGDLDRFEPKQGRTIQSGARGERTWLCFDLGAQTVRFEGRAEFLRWKAPAGIKEPVIYPYPLVEGTANFFWLLRMYVVEANTECDVHCQLGIWHPGGWRLGPYRPNSVAWMFGDHRWTDAHDETNVEWKADVSSARLRDAPDEVAHSALRDVYEHFGYEESAIPFWVDDEKRFAFEP